ncbi:hypothetical protein PQX77_002914 [Marasmius sp. AFHP31]|nr:hypothetical protein PQX77_002914 [Marasmius sp. AFHP31]
MYDSRTTELFYDGGPENDGNVMYAGTFEYLQLNHLHPEGFHYVGDIPGIDRLCEALVDTQTGGERLRTEDMKDFLKSGVIRLEFVGLRMVGFDADLHARLTEGSIMVPLDTEKDRDLEDLRRWFRLKFTDSGSTGSNHPSANDIVVQSTIHGKHASKPELNSSEDAESDSSNDSSSDSDVPLAKSDTLKRSAASQLAVVNKRQRSR